MATHRNRYVKLSLAAPCSTNLQNATVVGQADDYLLVERPQPKPRAKSTTPRKPRTVKVVAGGGGPVAQPTLAKAEANG